MGFWGMDTHADRKLHNDLNSIQNFCRDFKAWMQKQSLVSDPEENLFVCYFGEQAPGKYRDQCNWIDKIFRIAHKLESNFDENMRYSKVSVKKAFSEQKIRFIENWMKEDFGKLYDEVKGTIDGIRDAYDRTGVSLKSLSPNVQKKYNGLQKLLDFLGHLIIRQQKDIEHVERELLQMERDGHL